jgi:hypothetical protein
MSDDEQAEAGGRTARLVEEDGRLVIAGSAPITDADIRAIIDDMREEPYRRIMRSLGGGESCSPRTRS